MSMIDIQNLSFTYDGSYTPVFENVTFRLDTDWKLGLTGRNGCGKTTFLKLLTGELAFQGSIRAGVEFEYFPYPVEDPADFTVDVIRAAAPAAEDWQICRELSLLDVNEAALWQSFDTLSFGERTKALLAALFLKENAFLLIDEPTNHLDAAGRKKLAAYLAKKKGFLLVSHDRAFLDGCVDHMLSIDRRGITLQRGNFSAWWNDRMLREHFEQAEHDKLKKETARLETALQRTASWAGRAERGRYGAENSGLKVDRGYVGSRSARMMQRAKSIERRRSAALEENRELLKNTEREQPLSLWPRQYPARRLLELRDVSIQYDGRIICEPVSFAVERGDRVLLQGPNGCGKSSLLRLILGEDVPHSGTAVLGSGLTVSYVRQDTAALRGSLADFVREHDLEEHRFKAILRKFDFPREQFEKDLAEFSAGQKKKVLLAESLCRRAHLYLWDEPLNFVDVFSRIQLETLLPAAQPAMVFVEHDIAFAQKVATKVVDIAPA